MRPLSDSQGLVMTASSPDSIALFEKFVTAYIGFRKNTGALLNELIELDPDMPMALCAKGYIAKLTTGALNAKLAEQFSAKLNNQLDAASATQRERQHAAALTAWTHGQTEQATTLWEGILRDHPTDTLALKLTHFMHLYSGDGTRIRDSVARVLPHWPEDHPYYGYVLGMYAFGLEESGDYKQAEIYGRQAVNLNSSDAWSIHSVAHVMEMTGRHQEGIEWIDSLEPDWSVVNSFRFHLLWHKALYQFERGEFAAACHIYDEYLVSDLDADYYLDVCNATSLLWRLELSGVDVGNRWQELATVARTHLADKDLVFSSLHYLMALVASGDQSATTSMLENFREWSKLDTTQGNACASVALDLAEGLSMARQGDTAMASKKIESVRHNLPLVGGSIAQRDVFDMIMLDAIIAGDNAEKAQLLFASRVQQRPQSSWSWRSYGNALSKSGNSKAADEARLRASRITAH